MNIYQKSILVLSLCGLFLHSVSAESAKEAWSRLVGEKMRDRPEFAYVENDSALPNVLIYGDSISMGYTVRVRQNLKGKANVYRIHCNGGDTGGVIANIGKMRSAMADHWKFTWDVIHFNAGLHDLKYLDDKGKYDVANGRQLRSPEEYGRKLREILAFFREIAPGAKIIFATTTPVPEHSRGRKAADEENYNRSAREVLKEYPEVLVNDLHAFCKPNLPRWLVAPDNVHYKPEGCQAQGDEVARRILAAMAK